MNVMRKTRRQRMTTIAVVLGWIGIAALAVGIALAFLEDARPLAISVVAAGLGIASIVMARMSRQGHPRLGTIALYAGVVAAWGTIVLTGTLITSIHSIPPAMNDVSVVVSGEQGYEVFLIDNGSVRTLMPLPEWTFPASTSGDETLTTFVRAPARAPDSPVSCRIIWNGEVVVDHTAEGEVTCHYINW